MTPDPIKRACYPRFDIVAVIERFAARLSRAPKVDYSRSSGMIDAWRATDCPLVPGPCLAQSVDPIDYDSPALLALIRRQWEDQA